VPADDPAPLQRYTVPVDRDRREVVTAELWAAGATGVWEQPTHLIAWFPDREVDGLPPGGAFTDEPDRDWQAEWKATIRPVRAGRFAIVPTWLADAHEPEADEVTLVLDPGRAFGSGHHATTTLCLELLDELALDGRDTGDLSGLRVADVGCGSGVLAIAAARGGATVVGTDLDPDAVAVTAENAGRNGVAVRAEVGSTAEAARALGGPADVVLANLVTDTVAELADELVGLLRPGGTLIASGIATDREDVASVPLGRAGLTVDERRHRDGWSVVRGHRDAAGPAPPDGAAGGAPSGGRRPSPA
jgi:ribosomal protein L11 methyltransferase